VLILLLCIAFCQEQEEIEKLASKTYRERIEELNQHLGSLTEHHDVPRVRSCLYCWCVVWGTDVLVGCWNLKVSAAGNG
jgi:hypothetical protein